jgi:hypothetical protein
MPERLSRATISDANPANGQRGPWQGDVKSPRRLGCGTAADPESFPIILALTQLETRVGQTEEARAYLAKAKAMQPENEMVKRLDVALKYSDPYDALVHYCEVAIPNEADRAVQMATQLDVMAARQKELAAQLEAQAKATTDPAAKAKLVEGVTKCTELAARAAKEQPAWMEKARTLAPDNTQLLEFEFRKAISAKDWPTAEKLSAREGRESGSGGRKPLPEPVVDGQGGGRSSAEPW